MTAGDVQALLDKQAVYEVMMRYCRGVDRFDADLITSAYHPDARDDHTGKIFTGATIGKDIVEWLRPALKVVTHHITNHTSVIGTDGVTAGAESYYQGWHIEVRDGTERTMHTVGRYIDRLAKRDGQWRITDRLVVVELAHVAKGDIEVPAVAALARKDSTDPSYAVLGS